MSLFTQINPGKSADEVVHQIEALVLEGILRVGDRLPGERELASSTGVSRPIVREAIKHLEERGILEIRHGGGTFVGDVIGTVFSKQIASVLPHHKKATSDYLEFRREIEGASAAFASERATQNDRTLLSELMGKMEDAHAKEEFAREGEIDVEFHSLIGELAHNLILLHTLRSCYRLLSVGIFQNRERLYEISGARGKLLEQHHAIYQAIMDGDPVGARSASNEHIDFVLEQTNQLEITDERERIASLRFQSRL